MEMDSSSVKLRLSLTLLCPKVPHLLATFGSGSPTLKEATNLLHGGDSEVRCRKIMSLNPYLKRFKTIVLCLGISSALLLKNEIIIEVPWTRFLNHASSVWIFKLHFKTVTREFRDRDRTKILPCMEKNTPDRLKTKGFVMRVNITNQRRPL